MLVVAKVVNHVQRLPSLSSSISKSLESERPHHDPTLSERPKRLVLRVMHIWHLSRIMFEKSDPLISCAPLSGLEYDLKYSMDFRVYMQGGGMRRLVSTD